MKVIKVIILSQQNKVMDVSKNKNVLNLQIASSTWLKNSHSLYDYESQKVQTASFVFPVSCKAISVYRKRQGSTVVALDQTNSQQIGHLVQDNYQFLTRFQVKVSQFANKLKLNFQNQHLPKLKKLSKERVNTDQSNSAYGDNQQETYLVVRKIRDINNQQQGFKLQVGQIIKLGRVEYLVSQIRENGVISKAKNKKYVGNYLNSKIFKMENNEVDELSPCAPTIKNACKICLDEAETNTNFLFNPCLCTGSCGTVHIDCLTQWIHVKVKKQTIGGTTHFNFNKFQCEVCKSELPMIIQSNDEHKQLLPIQKPQSNYLILQGVNQKLKSVMLIQNTPINGIKLGRGHQCQIRITDISVSRSHACIKMIGNSFYIFDSKSKFGTLVRSESFNLALELDRISRVIQVGRTILSLDVHKEYSKYLKNKFIQ